MEHTVSFSNRWMNAVDGAHRRLSGLLALAVAVVTLAISLFGGVALYRSLPDLSNLVGGELGLALDRLLLYACTLASLYAVALASFVYERRARLERPAGAAGAAATGLAFGVLGFLAAFTFAWALVGVRSGAEASSLAHRCAGAAIAALLILFQAGGEELFFRGWLQPVLCARWGAWIGLVATAALFAAAHAWTGHISALALVNDGLAGAVFGLLALRSGGLWAAILAHWGWNWTEQALLGLTPNPGVDALGSLFDLDLVGPPWISGGADEMNGSAAATASLLLMLILAGLWRARLKR